MFTYIIVYYFLLQDFHILFVSQIVEMEGSYHLLCLSELGTVKTF